jgi:phosphotransferase system enzyme I (PtsI)
MAGDPLYALVLLGLGVTELSMVSRAIPAVKEIVRQSSTEDARRMVQEIWPLPTYQDVESHVVKAMHARFPSLVRDL